MEGPNINRRVFLDPNILSNDGTVALTGTQSFSEDGSIFAYGVSTSGSDWRKVYFINVSSNQQDLTEVLTKVKFTDIVWKGSEGIFYGVSSFSFNWTCKLVQTERFCDIIICSITRILRAIQKDLTLELTKTKKSVFTEWVHLKTRM